MKKELFIYDEQTGVFKDVIHVSNLNDYKYMITDSDELSFTSGYTDVAPPNDIGLYSDISPVFDNQSQTWNEDQEALTAHLEETKDQVSAAGLQTVDDLIQLVIKSNASTITELQEEIIQTRYGVSMATKSK